MVVSKQPICFFHMSNLQRMSQIHMSERSITPCLLSSCAVKAREFSWPTLSRINPSDTSNLRRLLVANNGTSFWGTVWDAQEPLEDKAVDESLKEKPSREPAIVRNGKRYEFKRERKSFFQQ